MKHFIGFQIMNLLNSSLSKYFYICVCVRMFLDVACMCTYVCRRCVCMSTYVCRRCGFLHSQTWVSIKRIWKLVKQTFYFLFNCHCATHSYTGWFLGFLFIYIYIYEQRDKIGVAVKSWLWERVELMFW